MLGLATATIGVVLFTLGLMTGYGWVWALIGLAVFAVGGLISWSAVRHS